MSQGTVTVYLPTHNRSRLLRRAVASVLAQTYADIELVVVDDGSTDATRATLLELAARDARVRPIFLARAGGACAARNSAIAAARGHWITGCDDDDYFAPARIAELVAAWQQLDEAGQAPSALYSPYWMVRSDGLSEFAQPEIADAAAMRTRNVVGNQVFTLTSTLHSLGGFDPQMPAWQDYELWLRVIAGFGPMRRAGSCSYYQDLSHGQDRVSTGQADRIRAAMDRLLAKHGDAYDRRTRAMLHLNYLQYEQVPFGIADLWRGVSTGHWKPYAATLLAKTRARLRRGEG